MCFGVVATGKCFGARTALIVSISTQATTKK